jgi:hypothetical protein
MRDKEFSHFSFQFHTAPCVEQGNKLRRVEGRHTRCLRVIFAPLNADLATYGLRRSCTDRIAATAFLALFAAATRTWIVSSGFHSPAEPLFNSLICMCIVRST